jgi:hypothetical protein
MRPKPPAQAQELLDAIVKKQPNFPASNLAPDPWGGWVLSVYERVVVYWPTPEATEPLCRIQGLAEARPLDWSDSTIPSNPSLEWNATLEVVYAMLGLEEPT